MQYKPAIVSPPILVSETKEIAIGGLGDTLNISLDVVYDTELHLESKGTIPLTPKPSVSLSMKHRGIIDVITRGESFDITVELTKALTTDITVDYTITEELIGGWDKLRSIKEINHTQDNFDYSVLLRTLPTDQLDLPTGTITIPAGSTSATVTVTSTANTELFYGKGSYFSSKVVLSNIVSTEDVMLNGHSVAHILYEDALSYPKWNNFEVELWGKLPHLSYYQPIYDPETSAVVKWTFDYDEGVDELDEPILTDTTLRTKIVDDIPLDMIQLRPVDTTTVPVDIENALAPIDLTTQLPFYKCIVLAGRRD